MIRWKNVIFSSAFFSDFHSGLTKSLLFTVSLLLISLSCHKTKIWCILSLTSLRFLLKRNVPSPRVTAKQQIKLRVFRATCPVVGRRRGQMYVFPNGISARWIEKTSSKPFLFLSLPYEPTGNHGDIINFRTCLMFNYRWGDTAISH